jgi:predicted alpha/beta-hydrolase family hydrolase
MTTTAAARGMLTPGREDGGGASVAGLVLVGFPLHPAGKPGTSRAEHLADVPHRQLYLQGTRDRLADLELLRPVLGGLGRRATLHVVEGADHGFHVLVRSGRTDDEVLDELADVTADWMDHRASDRSGS